MRGRVPSRPTGGARNAGGAAAPPPGSRGAARCLLLLLPSLAAAPAWAGPPYTTDDPEPVEVRHWEVYLATQNYLSAGGSWSGTAPQVEVNYGPLRNVQLHLIAPLAFERTPGGSISYGYGDTEVGVKVRFLEEGEWVPMVGTFPLVELPTGSAAKGLGNGVAQFFAPLWLQKTFGAWTTYGGAGYWVNPGSGNRNFWFLGWQAQYALGAVAPGGEVFHTSARRVGGAGETRFNLGLVADLSDVQHLIASAGLRFGSPPAGQFYAAYQLTFGPPAP